MNEPKIRKHTLYCKVHSDGNIYGPHSKDDPYTCLTRKIGPTKWRLDWIRDQNTNRRSLVLIGQNLTNNADMVRVIIRKQGSSFEERMWSIHVCPEIYNEQGSHVLHPICGHFRITFDVEEHIQGFPTTFHVKIKLLENTTAPRRMLNEWPTSETDCGVEFSGEQHLFMKKSIFDTAAPRFREILIEKGDSWFTWDKPTCSFLELLYVTTGANSVCKHNVNGLLKLAKEVKNDVVVAKCEEFVAKEKEEKERHEQFLQRANYLNRDSNVTFHPFS